MHRGGGRQSTLVVHGKTWYMDKEEGATKGRSLFLSTQSEAQILRLATRLRPHPPGVYQIGNV